MSVEDLIFKSRSKWTVSGTEVEVYHFLLRVSTDSKIDINYIRGLLEKTGLEKERALSIIYLPFPPSKELPQNLKALEGIANVEIHYMDEEAINKDLRGVADAGYAFRKTLNNIQEGLGNYVMNFVGRSKKIKVVIVSPDLNDIYTRAFFAGLLNVPEEKIGIKVANQYERRKNKKILDLYRLGKRIGGWRD